MKKFFETDDEFLSAVKITKLKEDATDLPTLIMQANLQYAETEYRYFAAKDTLTELTAEKYLSTRLAKEKAGIKVTEAFMNSVLDKDPELSVWRERIASIASELQKLKGLKDALQAKSVMLASMLGNQQI